MNDAYDSYPELLDDLRLQLSEQLVLSGLADADARRIAHNAAEHIRRHWGGQNPYIPKGREYDSRQLREAIVRDFSGNNKQELSRKYGLSVERVRQIIAADRKSRRG